MNKTTKILLFCFLLLGIILFVGVIFKSLYSELFLSHVCWAERNAKEMQFNGVIKNKSIDTHNHNNKAISVINNDGVSEIQFVDNEDSILWKKIMINDSIIKVKNSLIYYLKRGAQIDTINIKYDCKK